ncbi:MAG: hypothetical protein RMJ66_06060 [Bacteroidia bacterium]|nr:hypothetical protein [Bacteroidia bacterium]MDW8134615.1 hypothetical protein [Bacteroidia bacterium]
MSQCRLLVGLLLSLGAAQGLYQQLGLGQAYFRENKGQVRDQNWQVRWDCAV